jgi:hypothetical protein
LDIKNEINQSLLKIKSLKISGPGLDLIFIFFVRLLMISSLIASQTLKAADCIDLN